jgi:uroporphyrinogen III methyltransferase / synthase
LTARPLAGLTVLVPRARDQASDFSALLRARGAEPLEVPTIEIRPVASTAALDQAVEDLAAGRFDWVVLTSVNGVAALGARFEALGQDPASLAKAQVAAVGPATEAALRDWGVNPDLVPEIATTAALAQAFPPAPGAIPAAPGQGALPAPGATATAVGQGVPSGQDAAASAIGQRVPSGLDATAALGPADSPGSAAVLLARADLANPELAIVLRDKGWRTTEVVAYHTVPVGTLDPAARHRLDAGDVDWVAFTASSTVEGFLRGYGGPPPPGVRVAAIGPVTAETARAAGIRVATTATEHTIPGLVAAIEHAVGN